MGKKMLYGVPSKYDQITTNLCRDLKAKAVVLMVIEGREGTGMCVATRPDSVGFGHPEVLGDFLRSMADTMSAGVGPEGVGVHTEEPEN